MYLVTLKWPLRQAHDVMDGQYHRRHEFSLDVQFTCYTTCGESGQYIGLLVHVLPASQACYM